MCRRLVILFLILLTFQAKCQPLISLKSGFGSFSFTNHIQYLTDSSGILTFNDISRIPNWKPFAGKYPNFGENPYPHWLRFRVKNTSARPITMALLTKGIDSLQAFLSGDNATIKSFPVTGSHIPLWQREFPSAYLTLTFDLAPQREYTVWIRIQNLNYRLTASPFALYELPEAKRFLQGRAFLHSLYIGGMSIILLFSIVLTILFRERVYAYYFGCVVCSLSIMLIYNDYTFMLFDELPEIVRGKDIYGIITALVPSLYVLFAEKYLRITIARQSKLIMLSKVIILFQIALLAFFMMVKIPLFQVRVFFYLPMMALSIISFIYVFQGLRMGYRPAWLFLLATTPVSVSVLMETASDLHSIPVQEIHEYYYYATLFEMFALTFGLAYRFKIEFDQKRILQGEILMTQINTQEKERASIASDLHDVIGAQLSAIRLNLDFLQVQYFENSNKDWWAPVYKILNLLSENVSTIAARMRNSSLEKLGLTGILEQIYGHLDKPVFHFSFSGMQKRIPPYTERELYIVIVEALNNCIKHAHASQINVQIIKEKKLVTIFIEDNGVGFENGAGSGQGLRNMQARVREHLRGEFSVDTQPGMGTVIIIKIPLTE